MSHGKKYLEAAKKVDATKFYSLEEAVKLAVETSTTKFDSSLEIHMNLGIDTAQAEQALRATVALPHGTGKKLKVIAFVNEDEAKEAKAAGAIEAGAETLIEKIEKGWMDFDVAVATPPMMKSMGKIARQLGQAGLMPNPKSGTVTPDIKGTIAQIMKGQVEFRNDKQGNLHNIVGKVSFGADKILENVKSYLKAIMEKRPTGIKGVFVKSITLTTTMGPGVKVEVNPTLQSL
ncbi:50S ribosomal protein L1 [Candidatus Peregrinibacteria bacterium]|nr:50S ribosomal protein L1 [Candidatus Peregrinibacteria bacterium]